MLVEAKKPFQAPHKVVQPGEKFHAQDLYAKDLIRNGLAVEWKAAKTPQNKMAPTPENKADGEAGKPAAAGAVLPSSASPAAQVSQSQTSEPSKPGARPTLRLRKSRAKQ